DVLPHGWAPTSHLVHRVLTANPFYPVQIATGLCFGWVLGRRWQHRAMVWVWVLPLMVLCYVFFTATALIPQWAELPPSAGIQSRLSYYFGWGCQPYAHCLDQLLITMPFYVSVA